MGILPHTSAGAAILIASCFHCVWNREAHTWTVDVGMWVVYRAEDFMSQSRKKKASAADRNVPEYGIITQLCEKPEGKLKGPHVKVLFASDGFSCFFEEAVLLGEKRLCELPPKEAVANIKKMEEEAKAKRRRKKAVDPAATADFEAPKPTASPEVEFAPEAHGTGVPPAAYGEAAGAVDPSLTATSGSTPAPQGGTANAPFTAISPTKPNSLPPAAMPPIPPPQPHPPQIPSAPPAAVPPTAASKEGCAHVSAAAMSPCHAVYPPGKENASFSSGGPTATSAGGSNSLIQQVYVPHHLHPMA